MRAPSTMLLAVLLTAACSEPGSPLAWTSSSQRISISSFGVWQGLSGYERERSQLTAAQLEALAALEGFEPVDSCGTDQLGYTITITDAARVARVYHATQWDEACDATDPFVSMDSLKPFLDSFACRSSRDRAPDPPAIHPGDGCRHGFYMDGQGTAVRATLEVAAAGELDLVVEAGTSFAPRITLLDVDGATVLGSGADSLTYAFTAAGTYFVEVASSTAAHGDLLLRVE